MYFVKASKSTVEPRKKAGLSGSSIQALLYAQNHLSPGCVSHGRLSQAFGQLLKVPSVEPFYWYQEIKQDANSSANNLLQKHLFTLINYLTFRFVAKCSNAHFWLCTLSSTDRQAILVKQMFVTAGGILFLSSPHPWKSRGKIEREDPWSEVSHVWLVTVSWTFEFDWLYPNCLALQHKEFMNNIHVYCLPLLVFF